MKERKGATLDILENLEELQEPFFLASDLVDFLLDNFREEMSHDDSKKTRQRLLDARTALVNDLDELYAVLQTIDPDLDLEWKLHRVADDEEE